MFVIFFLFVLVMEELIGGEDCWGDLGKFWFVDFLVWCLGIYEFLNE